jgi:phosphate transport system permease protein
VAIAGGELLRRPIDNPHPEASLRTLFLPVHYEGYASAKWVWQTTGGSDAFEPKMSLWPLIFGTLKATLCAMVLSVPLALMAAVYVSQLARLAADDHQAHPRDDGGRAVGGGRLPAALWLARARSRRRCSGDRRAAALPLAVLVALALWRIAPPRCGGGSRWAGSWWCWRSRRWVS